ncbi:hypothetical protein [Nitratireductor sp. StC3]|uniref:hypothetical protein n=1 Tax=Nitratireductor sp. StC3 TaxID=2126741 RepID=UPI000D0CC281|nr:hypothetical protein [Nitratireductor sp. StC3]PSM18204.1 hypothetical protein C7T96_10050 [Nitratireductor sp. StC3]
MTEDERRIFRLAMLRFEETANQVVTEYFERLKLADGGAELVGRVSAAIEEVYQSACEGHDDAVLSAWRRVQ